MLLPPGHEKTELIEVVRITDPIRHMSSPDLVGDEVAIWEAARVTETLKSVGALPDSPLMRCFFPGWGIRAHSASGLLFQVAFCFQCHGARLWGPTVPGDSTPFTASTPTAWERAGFSHDSERPGRAGGRSGPGKNVATAHRRRPNVAP
ncbi:hypothetical protein [Streptomyces sp. NPDC051001]|uniref:hypothetical protein n=1 Tax=Streptomyces sp. NPDC051001 TaxID=3155795 RepID=UPI00344466FD